MPAPVTTAAAFIAALAPQASAEPYAPCGDMQGQYINGPSPDPTQSDELAMHPGIHSMRAVDAAGMALTLRQAPAPCRQGNQAGARAMAQEQPRPQISVIGILMRKGAWMVPLGLVFAALAGLAAVMEQRDARALDARGVETTAIITSTERRVRRDSDGERRVTYYARYRFDLPDGQTKHNRSMVTRRYFDAVSQGDAVWVRYLPDEPDTAEIERGRAREGSIVFALAALILGGGSVWLGWRSWQRSQPKIRAVRHGERRSARVLGHFKTLSGDGKNKEETPLFKLRWVDGQSREGISDVNRRAEELQAWPRDSEITILADPETGQTYWEEDLR